MLKLRLYDQPRPVVWALFRFFSKKYHHAYQIRDLKDWQRIVVRHSFYLPKLKVMYVQNFKSASSSIGDLMIKAGAALEKDGDTGLHWGHETWQTNAAAIEAASLYRFSFVRHPATRAVSAFNDLFGQQRNLARWRHAFYKNATGLRFGDISEANFDRYIAYLREAMAESKMFCDNHFRLQTLNLATEHLVYDRIGKVENYAADLATIVEEAGMTSLVGRPKTRPVNRSISGAYSSPSNAQLRQLHKIYEEDYDRFEYALTPKKGAVLA